MWLDKDLQETTFRISPELNLLNLTVHVTIQRQIKPREQRAVTLCPAAASSYWPAASDAGLSAPWFCRFLFYIFIYLYGPLTKELRVVVVFHPFRNGYDFAKMFK